MHGVLDAGLLLLHLGLGGRTDLDDGDAADELREPLLQLLAVVVRGGLLDLGADLLDAALDRLAACRAPSYDRRVVLVDDDLLASPRSSQLDVLELDAEVLGDELAAGEDARCPRAWPCGDRRSPAP